MEVVTYKLESSENSTIFTECMEVVVAYFKTLSRKEKNQTRTHENGN
jgi:hypothetical protein